ncbi:MAG: ImmA/IrrE family metallo-endopeptidase [Actinomycetota bacterium]|nr:ImmA/IrrE family metallo-endopeptidase [Actinomycetota bacterium]
MRGKWFGSEELERRARELLNIYRRKSRTPLRLPIQADLVAESVGLDILWDPIPEEPDRTIFAEIQPDQRLIVVNDRRREVLEGTFGLYNTTVAHELGHWWLHVDHDALDHEELPGYVLSTAPPRQVDGRDKRDERNAGEFMGHLLMPRATMLWRSKGLDLLCWQDFYRLRDAFGVTTTAMKIRLEQLGLAYIDPDGNFHKSREEAEGQGCLF